MKGKGLAVVVTGAFAFLFVVLLATRSRDVARPSARAVVSESSARPPVIPEVVSPRGPIGSAPNAAAADPVAGSDIRPLSPVLAPDATSLDSVLRIGPDALNEKVALGQVRIIDVRDADSYAAGHIPGALQIPLAYIESEASYLREGKPIVTYCT